MAIKKRERLQGFTIPVIAESILTFCLPDSMNTIIAGTVQFASGSGCRCSLPKHYIQILMQVLLQNMGMKLLYSLVIKKYHDRGCYGICKHDIFLKQYCNTAYKLLTILNMNVTDTTLKTKTVYYFLFQIHIFWKTYCGLLFNQLSDSAKVIIQIAVKGKVTCF